MLKQKRNNRSSELMEWFYNQEFDKDTDDRIKEKFTLWFLDNQSEEKEEILEELFRREFFNVDNGLRVPPEKKAEYELLLDKYKRIAEAKKATKRILLRKVMMRVAAVVLPLLILSGVWFATGNKPAEVFAKTWSIANGATENIALPDSTHIVVNSGSRLSITQSKSERTVELSGESHFSVARDEDRPFMVKTNELTITVLGTEFNVEAYPDSEVTIVTLTEGKIALDLSNGAKYTLTPNEQLVYNRTTNEAQLLKMSDADDSRAWMYGKLVCKMKTLTEIFKMIERKYNIKIDINPDVHLSDLRYTTEFGADVSAERILESLKIVAEQFDFAVNGNEITIIKPENI